MGAAILRGIVVPPTAITAFECDLLSRHARYVEDVKDLLAAAIPAVAPSNNRLTINGIRVELSLEPMTRIELVTSSLPRTRSTY